MEKWLESLYSDGTRYYVSNPYPKKGETITIYIRVYEKAPVKAIFLRNICAGEEELHFMDVDRVENGLIYRSCRVTVCDDIFHYHFYIVTDNTVYYYNQLEITDCVPDELFDFKILVDKNVPKWTREGAIYHIFPERFCNGDPSKTVKVGEYENFGHPIVRMDDWNEPPKEYKEVFCMDFYGGDLIGIKKKIPYLKEMGVTTVYLNPIFTAPTVHKYDAADYLTVDPHFGGDKALKELSEELHRNGMKLILDISINHTGTEHKWFVKNGTFFDKSRGAYNNPNAAEREYYLFGEDNSYHSWGHSGALPTLNFASSKLRDKLYRNKDSVLKKWLEPPYRIDGWRFDVAHMMARQGVNQYHKEVWPEIREAIKSVNKQAYILGENWTDASEFLKDGDMWDASMNYFGFAWPVREFVGETGFLPGTNEFIRNAKKKMTAKQLNKRIKQNICKLPTVVQENQFNLLDSHDISRLHNNPGVSYEDYRGAVIMLFTMIGIPSIYYGDEATIDGRINSIEGCRYPMPWDKEYKDSKQYQLYQKLGMLRKKIEAFKYGGYRVISDNDYVFAYARFTHDELWVSVISTDDEERVVDIPIRSFGKSHFSCSEDILGTKIKYTISEGVFHLTVEPHTSYLLGF